MTGAVARFRWELLLAALIVAAGAWSASLSPFYLEPAQLLGSAQYFVIFGTMAFGLMPVVVHGEIDISLASTLAVGTVLFARLADAGLPIAVAIVAVLAACGVLGAVNGVLVAYTKLPSLAVTLGTLGAYRGLAYIIGGEAGFSDFPSSYTYVGFTLVGLVPVSLFLFAGVALVTGFLMSATPFGRYSYAIGHNPAASRYAGVPVVRTKILAYVFAALTAGLAGLLWIGQYGSARADNADGSILVVLTAVVLGGVSIKGGSGNVTGVVLAILLLGTLTNGMGLANVSGTTQSLVQGLLLVLSVAIPKALSLLRARHRLRAPPRAQPVDVAGARA
jgi:rhamnose transport system permease protein